MKTGILFVAVIWTLGTPLFGQNPPDPSTYRLGPKDVVEIKVFEASELNVRQPVSEEGNISLPHVGDVRVAGRTQSELVTELKKLLEADYVEIASVTVELIEVRARPISVMGAVRTPGEHSSSGNVTLLEALSGAGGLADNHGNRIQILRRAENGLTDQLSVEIRDVLAGADHAATLPIFANDLINVERAIQVTIYCLGEVVNPGAIEFKSTERVTLLAAIARAGGLSDRASSKIRIRRGSRDGSTSEIEVHYKRVLDGDEADPKLFEGDLIVVKESFF